MATNLMWTVMLILMGASFLVQTILNRRFNKYSKVMSPKGLTGAEVAEAMLRDHGISDVRIEHVKGKLTDHYNPTNKTLNLSDGVYGSRSIAAAAVAAHECGHAVQHARGYAPLRLRSALVPVVSFASNWVQWIILAGLIFFSTFPELFWGGIILFACTTLFSFITLPVELNASYRAVEWLRTSRIADSETLPMASSALRWAASTYVIAALSSLATLFYYIALASNRK